MVPRSDERLASVMLLPGIERRRGGAYAPSRIIGHTMTARATKERPVATLVLGAAVALVLGATSAGPASTRNLRFDS
jgi:hypothetical protein